MGWTNGSVSGFSGGGHRSMGVSWDCADGTISEHHDACVVWVQTSAAEPIGRAADESQSKAGSQSASSVQANGCSPTAGAVATGLRLVDYKTAGSGVAMHVYKNVGRPEYGSV